MTSLGDSMSTVKHAHPSRRRGFGVISQLARQNDGPSGRRAAGRAPNERANEVDYEPRHRREGAEPSFSK
jgi:hypothetical protein